jgi:hypothetical protein
LMPSYASFNIALSLCMIMAIIALLVGRSQSFASPHFVLSMSSTRASNSCWYVSNVSIIFYAPCLFLHHLLSVLLHFVAFLCIFWN